MEMVETIDTVDDINPALRTLNNGNYAKLLIMMGSAGSISSTGQFSGPK